MSAVMKDNDLDLKVEQVVALVAIHGVSVAIGAFTSEFGLGLQTAMAPILSQAVSVALSSTKCPFGAPAEDIVEDFDSKRDRYFHCLHSPRHCWNWRGRYVECPS